MKLLVKFISLGETHTHIYTYIHTYFVKEIILYTILKYFYYYFQVQYRIHIHKTEILNLKKKYSKILIKKKEIRP